MTRRLGREVKLQFEVTIQLGIVKDARDYDRHYLTRQLNSIGISKLAPPILYLASFNIPGCMYKVSKFTESMIT